MLTCEMRESALARLGRALADPTRCRILVALLDGVCYPGQLAAHLGLTRSNVSNHLSCLRGCGLVVATYEGRQVRYALADSHLARAWASWSRSFSRWIPTNPVSPSAPRPGRRSR